MTPTDNAHAELHRLWTKARGLPEYDTQEWLDLEAAIGRLRARVAELEQERNTLRRHRTEAHRLLSEAGVRTHYFADDTPANVEASLVDRTKLLCAENSRLRENVMELGEEVMRLRAVVEAAKKAHANLGARLGTDHEHEGAFDAHVILGDALDALEEE